MDISDSASQPPDGTSIEATSFSTFMADMKEQAAANSHLNHSERFREMAESTGFRNYHMLLKVRSRMINCIAFLPAMVVCLILAVYLYFFPDSPLVEYLNGYVVLGFLLLYLVVAATFAYRRANIVAFRKMKEMQETQN